MPIATKIDRFMQEGGWIRRMFETGIALKRQYGEDKVFDLSLGNPVAEPPPQFHQELRRLSQDPPAGMHRYMPNAGYAETREAVAQGLREETGQNLSAADIVMTCGAAGAINVVLKTVLNPGDEVVILSPYFVEYGYYTDNHGGIPVVVPTDHDFQLDLGRIEEALTERSKALLINSPNNPSGVIYSEEAIRALGDLLTQVGKRFDTTIYLVSDEPYRRIIYDGLVYPQVFPHYGPSIVVNSHAKDLALPGERIGHIAVNPNHEDKAHLVDGLTFCNRILGFVNAPALMQHAVRALQGVTVGRRGLPAQAGLPARAASGYGVLGAPAPRCFLPLSPLTGGRRCRIRSRATGVERSDSSWTRLRHARPFPNLLLCGRLGNRGVP